MTVESKLKCLFSDLQIINLGMQKLVMGCMLIFSQFYSGPTPKQLQNRNTKLSHNFYLSQNSKATTQTQTRFFFSIQLNYQHNDHEDFESYPHQVQRVYRVHGLCCLFPIEQGQVKETHE